MKYFFQLALLLTGLFILGCSEKDPVTSPDPDRQISLGAILALDGSLSYYGVTAQAALELAVEDINQELGTEIKLNPISIRNSYTNPDSALAALQALKGSGLNIIIGPQSSSAVEHVRTYADENNMVLISPSSVARSLKIAGDNVFRFSSDDTYQADAIAAMAANDELAVMITVYRDDTWGSDLSGLITDNFENQQIQASESLSYEPADTEFGSMLNELEDIVAGSVDVYGAEKVGVCLLSFGEAEKILEEASTRPELAKVKWYGASAIAQSPRLLQNPNAAAFAQTTGYPCPILALNESLKSKWEPLKARIKSATGQEADIYALVTYDAVQVAARDLLAIGNDDVSSFIAKLPETAASYTGMTGPIELNAAGDRAIGNYDFWAIRDKGNGPQWERVAFYNSTTKMLTQN